MLYHLFYPLSSDYSIFNVFRYITFRSAYSGLTALALCLILGSVMIRALRKYQIGERVRDYGPQHSAKSGTPTMGGLLILFSFLLSTLLWADLTNAYIWVIIFSALGFGLLGLYDDIQKLRKGKGVSIRQKLFIQALLALAVGYYVIYLDPNRTDYATRLF
ncbi:MAG: phospho-N-acetylmuramoyl-pentapeptide-transferase, partial [Nitrospinaceae bacterium]|nr:phospho-N-acetylmuramoyl-pentapeptide-transferase [Nitrospinaceae bacterium]NIS85623.1 phospho-N-acetylmuramoyl-pentapeptide-transferase [Nitrospinaceae bacterium]NIT82468.1 phospho-N-acetylmuramoyl-pentapeptide-transferase [Nitrospinaceae bacterium]NIU96840.1 phospho-N-acetylmuramoyl-pentapeptide-transferase [Nitrospinaceae bacterium]NIY15704.1 phospho-N-acetylmuramoyl-pentapeptide-transferase [Nitrospinaceae bacterium]